MSNIYMVEDYREQTHCHHLNRLVFPISSTLHSIFYTPSYRQATTQLELSLYYYHGNGVGRCQKVGGGHTDT